MGNTSTLAEREFEGKAMMEAMKVESKCTIF